MTKYTELTAAFAEAKIKFDQYLMECDRMAVEIWNELIAYNEVPPAQLELFLFDESGVSQKVNGPVSSALILREDAYFEFGIGLTVYVKENATPQETVVLPVHVMHEGGDQFKARLGSEGPVFSIDITRKGDTRLFTDHILDSLKEQYELGLSKIIHHNAFRRIGYKSSGMHADE